MVLLSLKEFFVRVALSFRYFSPPLRFYSYTVVWHFSVFIPFFQSYEYNKDIVDDAPNCPRPVFTAKKVVSYSHHNFFSQRRKCWFSGEYTSGKRYVSGEICQLSPSPVKVQTGTHTSSRFRRMKRKKLVRRSKIEIERRSFHFSFRSFLYGFVSWFEDSLVCSFQKINRLANFIPSNVHRSFC